MARAKYALALKDIYERKAKANQQLSQGRGQKGLPNSVDLNPVNTQAELATLANVSKGTLHSAETVLENGVPELEEAIEKGEVSITRRRSLRPPTGNVATPTQRAGTVAGRSLVHIS